MRAFFLRLWMGALLVFTLMGGLTLFYYIVIWPSQYATYLEDTFLAGHVFAAHALEAGRYDLVELNQHFPYPVHELARADLPKMIQAQFDGGEAIGWDPISRGGIYVPMPQSTTLLKFGPMPQEPHGEATTQLILILLAGAVAAWVLRRLLRPLKSELGSLEGAAAAWATGDYALRLEAQNFTVTGPLAQAFNAMASATQASTEAQQALFRAVSHELRSPIARLQMGTHLLAAEVDEKRAAHRLARLDDDFLELDALVEELMTYARLGAAHLDGADITQFQVDTVLHAHINKVEEGAKRHGMDLKLTVKARPEIRGERRLFERAVGNLIQNALRYGKAKVEVQILVDKRDCVIEVWDDGPGIAPEKREEAFEPFIRLAPERYEGGHGMGLAIVRRIVHHHGAEIHLGTSPLGGCCARLRWPRADTA